MGIRLRWPFTLRLARRSAADGLIGVGPWSLVPRAAYAAVVAANGRLIDQRDERDALIARLKAGIAEAERARDEAKARADEFARVAFHGDITWREVAEMRLEKLQRMAEILSDYMEGP